STMVSCAAKMEHVLVMAKQHQGVLRVLGIMQDEEGPVAVLEYVLFLGDLGDLECQKQEDFQ
ncbi:hypothetical protein PIB30_111759, partial [Stylosanthes scabra]|nr:hypothetical protein [Stylosanthes scabra]